MAKAWSRSVLAARIERDELDVGAIVGTNAVDVGVQVAEHGRCSLLRLGEHVVRELAAAPRTRCGPDRTRPGTRPSGRSARPFGSEALDGQRRAPMNMPFNAS